MTENKTSFPQTKIFEAYPNNLCPPTPRQVTFCVFFASLPLWVFLILAPISAQRPKGYLENLQNRLTSLKNRCANISEAEKRIMECKLKTILLLSAIEREIGHRKQNPPRQQTNTTRKALKIPHAPEKPPHRTVRHRIDQPPHRNS